MPKLGRISVICHPETAEPTITGQKSELHLSNNGREQARKIVLGENHRDKKLMIFASPSHCCRETADIIAETRNAQQESSTTVFSEPWIDAKFKDSYCATRDGCVTWDECTTNEKMTEELQNLHMWHPYDTSTKNIGYVTSGMIMFRNTLAVLSHMEELVQKAGGPDVAIVADKITCQIILNVAEGCNPTSKRKIQDAMVYPVVVKPNPLELTLAPATWHSIIVTNAVSRTQSQEKFMEDLINVCSKCCISVIGGHFDEQGRCHIERKRYYQSQVLIDARDTKRIADALILLGYTIENGAPPPSGTCTTIAACYKNDSTHLQIPDAKLSRCSTFRIFKDTDSAYVAPNELRRNQYVVESCAPECVFVEFPEASIGDMCRAIAKYSTLQGNAIIVYSSGMSITHVFAECPVQNDDYNGVRNNSDGGMLTTHVFVERLVQNDGVCDNPDGDDYDGYDDDYDYDSSDDGEE